MRETGISNGTMTVELELPEAGSDGLAIDGEELRIHCTSREFDDGSVDDWQEHNVMIHLSELAKKCVADNPDDPNILAEWLRGIADDIDIKEIPELPKGVSE